MKEHLIRGFGPAIVLATVLGLTLASCDDDDGTGPGSASGTHYGAAQTLGNGEARTFVEIDDSGNPTALGVTLSEEALTGLPSGSTPLELVLMLPAEAERTPFQHVTLDWNPAGHEPPGTYDLPHFDVHFYTIADAERQMIAPDDPQFEAKLAAAPAPEYMPAGYIQFPGGVPRMGSHWGDPTSPEHHGETFTTTLLWGSYDGSTIFVEPMMTAAWLETQPMFEEQLTVPAQYQVDGFWPTTYGALYDAEAQEYRIYIGGLTDRDAG